MMNGPQVKFSMLDLVSVREGGSVAEALAISLGTARHAESLFFNRYWLAEHHNAPGIASSATAVLVGYIAGGTTRIRVGSGGVMLPNHAPLVVAEAFGTLAEIYPDRIDLGLGRAPGTDQFTMRALRRDRPETEADYPRDIAELQRLLGPLQDGQRVLAVPGSGTNVPIWLLGSSLFSAQLAAHLGLPYAFAAHFAPALLHQALAVYRNNFRPSASLAKPYAMVGVPIIAAPTDEEAEYLASSTYQRILGILRGERRCLPAPVAGFMDGLHPHERSAISDFMAAAIVGGPETIRMGLTAFIESTGADELMIMCDIFDPDLRLRSLDIIAERSFGAAHLVAQS